MTRWTMLACFATTALFACGGRTTLDDLGTDASAPFDGGIVVHDGGVVLDSGIPVPPGDADLPPLPDAGPPTIDAGSPGGPIACGNTSCNSATETCCVAFNGNQQSETCEAPTQCTGAQFDCSSAASCGPNMVCCAQLSQTNAGSQCAPSCPGTFQNPQLCATKAECPNGLSCKPTPFGFSVCRP